MSLPLGSPQALSPLLPFPLLPPRSHTPSPPEANESPVIHFRLSWVIAAPSLSYHGSATYSLLPMPFSPPRPSSKVLPTTLLMVFLCLSCLVLVLPTSSFPNHSLPLMIVLLEGQVRTPPAGVDERRFPPAGGAECVLFLARHYTHHALPSHTVLTPSCRPHQPRLSITHPYYHLPFPSPPLPSTPPNTS